MTGNYQRGGIQFLYPENWTLADDSMDAFPRTISVQAPSGAFWSVDIHPFSVDPDELLSQVLEAMRGEYADLEASVANEDVVGNESRGYDLFFCCLDFIVAARLRAFRRGHATLPLDVPGGRPRVRADGACFSGDHAQFSAGKRCVWYHLAPGGRGVTLLASYHPTVEPRFRLPLYFTRLSRLSHY